MKATLFLLGMMLLCAGRPAAEASMRSARQARQMLGPEIWARTLRIENTNARSPYPAVTYATVFEFDSVLWLYTATDGTQSLSRHLGRLEEDKVDLLPLLQRIEPGFADYEMLPVESGAWAAVPRRLINGCFIESVAALRAAFDSGVPMTGAALLTYYLEIDGRRLGHTVLVYTTAAGAFVVDRARGRLPRALALGSVGGSADAVAGARAAQGNYLADHIVRARWVQAEVPARRLAPAYVGTEPGVVSAPAG